MRRPIPELAAEFERTQKGELKAGWEKAIPSFPVDKQIATRNAGGVILNAIAEAVPELFGGAADLTASTQDHLQARSELPRRSGRAQRLLRRARVRNGRRGERNCRAWRADSLRLHILCLLRLRQAGDPSGGADAGSFALCLYPRHHCPGRRWADPPAGRAVARPARHSGPDRLPPRRRQRDGGGVAAGRRAHRAELLRADPAESADHRRRLRTMSTPESARAHTCCRRRRIRKWC